MAIATDPAHMGGHLKVQYQTVVVLSGGMDSTTALAAALHRPNAGPTLAVSFNYGQRHRGKELRAAKDITRHYQAQPIPQLHHIIIDLESLGSLLKASALTEPDVDVPDGRYDDESMRITVVPNRNAIMLSIAFGIARAERANEVYAGMHAGDHAIYPDCRADFVYSFSQTMDLANVDLPEDQRPQLIVPFVGMSKADIVKIGMPLGVPYHLTWSCYKGETLHCGTCGTCVERQEAFELAGFQDPTLYAS